MKRLAIIVVDNDSTYLLCLKDFLNYQGMEALTANGAEAAIRAIENRKFDLLLTDLEMPEMDGIELARKVRDMRPEMPIIMHTANLSPDHYSLVDKSIVSKVLEKSISPRELLEVIKQSCPAKEIQ